MKTPYLRRQEEVKTAHGYTWSDYYSWIHQSNCLEILQDKSKLNPEVRKYLEEENAYTEKNMSDTKELQKKLFKEIEGRIKLEDESLKYKDRRYEYWSKTTKEGNYTKYLRKKIGEDKVEMYWDGDKEAKGKKFFNAGDIEVSHNDEMLAFSIDDKGSEYFTIYVRNIGDGKIIGEPILETAGGITWAYDDKSFFYSKLDKLHRPRQIFQHVLGTSPKEDKLIYNETDERFTASLYLTSDENYYMISATEHTTSEIYYIHKDDKNLEPKLFIKREDGVQYSINSWAGYFWMNTNKDAEDFKVARCSHENINQWEDFIPAKSGTLIGGLTFLKDWIVRSEMSNALSKIYVRDIKTNKEEELIITEEKVISPGISLMQKDKDTDWIRIGYESPKTPSRVFEYNIKTKEKKLVKEQIVPSGHNRDDYIVERLEVEGHDGYLIPITILRHKKTKLDGSAHVLQYGYGMYGISMNSSFSSSRLSLVNRDIIWVTCHIRGGMEKGMKHWKSGKMMNKKNTFEDFISCTKYLIEKKYTSKKKIIVMGGSGGGLLLGYTVNHIPHLLLGAINHVGFLNPLETSRDYSLPLTLGETREVGDPKNNKKHFEYIRSYSPYDNIKKIDYPNILITTSLGDSRVLFDEPTMYCARLRYCRTDNNLQVFKCEMDAGHSSKSGRTAAIEEVAFDYAFALKISGKLNVPLEN